MSHYTIHAPWEIDDRFIDKYRESDLSEYDQVYASMIESMDKSLGDIMHTLRRLGIEKNTVIIFMTDNGQPSSSAPNLPLRGHKGMAYEAGPRVPCIIKWPGVAEPGTRCSEYFIIEDMFPSILEIAGVKDHSQTGDIIDGRSIVPLLKGVRGYPSGRPVFWHSPHIMHAPYIPFSAVRKGDWKLIYFHMDRRLELYNLLEDIGENDNLALKEKEKTNELAGILSDYLRETRAGMSLDKRTGKLVEYPDEIIKQGIR
jgi:arylsulfatase A-like enzyme